MVSAEEILNYNFNPEDIHDYDFEQLYSRRRRDSVFAYVYKNDDAIIALRDHLGIVPLYYRKINNKYHFSTNLSDLILADDEIDPIGMQYYLALGTPRIYPLIKGISIVGPGTVLKFDEASLNSSVIYRYKMKPKKISNFTGNSEIVNTIDSLMIQAIKRVIKFQEVGLYLSGGMDSSLIALYLLNMEVKVNAYTSASEGNDSPDAVFARKIADHLEINKHYIDTVDYKDIKDLIPLITKRYSSPHGTSVATGIASLWENTPIGEEKQIFFGQNSDTMSCAVGIQVRMCFRRFIPKFIRTRLGITYNGKTYKLPDDDILNNYIYLRSRGIVHEYDLMNEIVDKTELTNYQLMSVAGMYFGHVPHDGESLSQPAFNKNILISNPYYDIDLIEYNLGIPFRHRFSFIFYPRKKFPFIYLKPVFKKRAMKKLARKYFPKKMVHKKKGFSVALNNMKSFSLITLPDSIMGIRLDNIQSKLSAAVLRDWCIKNNLNILE